MEPRFLVRFSKGLSMKHFAILLVGVSLSLAACGKDPGPKGDKGDPGITNVRAVQTDGAVTCEASETLVSVFCPSGGAADGPKCATAPTVGLCLKKP